MFHVQFQLMIHKLMSKAKYGHYYLGLFPHSPRATSWPQKKLQQCMSDYRAENLWFLRTEETAPERQTHTAANLSEKGGGKEVRQLESGSHHYRKENKTINTPATSPNPPHPYPLRLILAEAPGTPQAAQHCIQLLGQHRDFRTPLSNTFSHRSGSLELRQPDHSGETHLPKE